MSDIRSAYEEWLPGWCDSLGLSVAFKGQKDQTPGGGGILDALEKSETFADSSNVGEIEWKRFGVKNGIAVDHFKIKDSPVFTAQWSCTVKNSSFEAFEKFTNDCFDSPPDWDDTYLFAEKLEERNGVLLVKWHFKAAPLGKREMLYLTIPHKTSEKSTVHYISVTCSKHPRTKGFTRAFNFCPSYDRCILQAGVDAKTMKLEHCMTTAIGGWIPNAAWNNVFFKPVVKQMFAEGMRVRNLYFE